MFHIKEQVWTDIDDGQQEANRLVNAAMTGIKGRMGELTAYLAKSTGKGIRTQVLLCAAMDDEGRVPKDSAKAAAAIELLHMATLIHDDVIDDADLRRGHPTLHKKFGNKGAVLCGDYLLSLSILTLAGMEVENNKIIGTYSYYTPKLAKALADVCQGEFDQHLHNGNIDLPVFTYLRIIAGKTAALFYFAAFLGGMIGGEDEANVLALGRFGRQLGMVFQIVDDCKDYEWSESKAQKPVGNDPKNGVITLPLIMALGKNPSLRKQAQEVIRDRAAVASLLAAVRGTNGAGMARELARRFQEKAVRSLEGVRVRKREELLSLLHSVL